MSSHSKSRTRIAVVALSIVLGAAACSDPNSPEVVSTVNVTLSTEAVDDPGGDYVRVAARLVNATPDSVTYYPNCGPSYWFSVFDEDGNLVRVNDPTFGTLCPREKPMIAPGESTDQFIDFAWGWTDAGERYRLPAGEYTVQIRILYYEGESLSLQIARRSTILQWEQAAAEGAASRGHL